MHIYTFERGSWAHSVLHRTTLEIEGGGGYSACRMGTTETRGFQLECDFDFSPHFTLSCQIGFCSADISFMMMHKNAERLRNEADAALHASQWRWHHRFCSSFLSQHYWQQQLKHPNFGYSHANNALSNPTTTSASLSSPSPSECHGLFICTSILAQPM